MLPNAELLDSKPWSVSTRDLERYAWVSGDINPIHFDPKAAQELGLPGTIVHGLFAHAKLMSEILKTSGKLKLGAMTGAHTKFSAMMPAPGDYRLEIYRGSKADTVIARVLNEAGAVCVEVQADHAPK